MKYFPSARIWLVAVAAVGAYLIGATPAAAQDAAAIQSIQRQIQQLQAQLKKLQADAARRDTELKRAQDEAAQARAQAQQAQKAVTTPPATMVVAAPPEKPLPKGTFKLGAVTVTLGGFLEAAGIYRTRNEVADIASSFNTGIPLPNSPAYQQSEFRGSARHSRMSLLVQGDPDGVTHISGYGETDFLGVGTSSNSLESNSYVPRLRQAYATYERSDLGLHLLGGQAWSLVTMNKVGITPRQENTPLVIDGQNVVGFNWTRNWQLRAVKDFADHRLWLGASVEGPQAAYTGATPSGVTVTATNPGGSGLNSNASYSTDTAPDVVIKAAADPGWGHYELFGLARFFSDRVSTAGSGTNYTEVGGGIGGGMILPLVPGMLDFQVSGLVGNGIGRYGSAQLPDVTYSPTGRPTPIAEYTVMGGLIGHPTPAVDVYGYAGAEEATRKFWGSKLGYGNPTNPESGCNIELSTICTANTSGVVEGTAGVWWRFLQGNYGTMQLGAQYEYLKRNIFPGAGAKAGTTATTSTDENIFLVSFRYYPFQ